MAADQGDFSPKAARELHGLRFGVEDQAQMQSLSRKAQQGSLRASCAGRIG